MSWQPTVSIEAIRARSELLQVLRSFFIRRDFLEVQTPVLSRDTVIDRHLDPIVVSSSALGISCAEHDWYLQTSPEFGMKRMVAAGLPAIFQIGPAFRSAESGPLHNPEFTMLEWYRVGDDYAAAIACLEELTHAVLTLANSNAGLAEPAEPIVRIASYQQIWRELLGIDPLESTTAELAAWASAQPELGVRRDWSLDKDDWLHLIFDGTIQPRLGDPALILTHYPASQSALAKIAPGDSRLAERFELFINGVELANGYHELTDASELEKRNAAVNAQRIQDGKAALPAHSHLLDAMQAGLPACGGCALGVDRLLMVLLGKRNIDEVLCFPAKRA